MLQTCPPGTRTRREVTSVSAVCWKMQQDVRGATIYAENDGTSWFRMLTTSLITGYERVDGPSMIDRVFISVGQLVLHMIAASELVFAASFSRLNADREHATKMYTKRILFSSTPSAHTNPTSYQNLPSGREERSHTQRRSHFTPSHQGKKRQGQTSISTKGSTQKSSQNKFQRWPSTDRWNTQQVAHYSPPAGGKQLNTTESTHNNQHISVCIIPCTSTLAYLTFCVNPTSFLSWAPT